jgi:hypothetical protein
VYFNLNFANCFSLLTKFTLFFHFSSSDCSFLVTTVDLEWWVLVATGLLGRTGSSNVGLESLAFGISGGHVGGVHGEVVGLELLLGGNGLEGEGEGVSLSLVGIVWSIESDGRGGGDEGKDGD